MQNSRAKYGFQTLLIIILLYAVSVRAQGGQRTVSVKQNGPCTAEIGTSSEDVINLEPLARTDGFPRYVTVFNFSGHPWNYSFNPCKNYNIPPDNPHQGYGDSCHSVSICKYAEQNNIRYYYTLGLHSTATFNASFDSSNNTVIQLIHPGYKSMRARSTVINLVCDRSRKGVDDGIFTIIADTDVGVENVHAELRHVCCCPGGCWNTGLGQVNVSERSSTGNSKKPTKGDGGTLLFIAGTVVALLMLVALIGGLCYVKRTHLQIYSKLPALHSNSPGQPTVDAKTMDFRDYEPSSISRKKLLPVLEDTMIPLDSLDMCQRLGGGIFGDTHLAKWKEITVAVKRLTLLVHENQITPEALKLMKNEVWFLSRQRHKNIVTILGLCLDGKLPSIITEYVIGECLKDFLRVQGKLLSWPHRVRICAQVADGMAFLHSTKPPIIHRDLRCGNLFLSDNDVVKVADFGLIKLLQPVREECPEDDCCCRRTMSACPPSIRWTAPELLAHPRAREGPSKDGSCIITTSCDVYSFAMVMWELPMCEDPFEEISTEAEVVEIVKNGGRPDTPPSADMMPQYKEMMKHCWDQLPELRPSFKQIATGLKDLGPQARSYQKHLMSRQRLQKLQQENLHIC